LEASAGAHARVARVLRRGKVGQMAMVDGWSGGSSQSPGKLESAARY
jgi:hypothetical protein